MGAESKESKTISDECETSGEDDGGRPGLLMADQWAEIREIEIMNETTALKQV